MSLGFPRPVVPISLHRKGFDILHSLSHPGSRPTKRLIAARYVWPGFKKDITLWAKCCLTCQQSKISRHVASPLQSFPVPSSRFEHLHVDIVGPFLPSRGYTYLFTVIDRFTRWPEAIPMADCTAQTCAQAFLSGWIARFGVPASVTSDRGRQFISELWRNVLHLFGIKPTQTTSYHPQANGMVERMHRQLKASLKARLTTAAWSHPQANGMVERMHRQLKASLKARLTTAAWSHPQANGMVERMHRQLKASLKARLTTAAWCTQLPIVLLGMRTALKEDLGTSAAELVYGTTLHLPGDFIHQAPQMTSPGSFADQLRQHMAQLRPSPVITHSQRAFHVPCDLQSATHVFVRHDSHRSPLQRPYDGPFRVLHRSAKFFKVDLGSHTDNVSIDRLKAAFIERPSLPPSPTPRSQSPLATTVTPQHRLSPTAPPFVPSTPSPRLPAAGYVTKAGRTIHPPARLCSIVEDHWGGTV